VLMKEANCVSKLGCQIGTIRNAHSSVSAAEFSARLCSTRHCLCFACSRGEQRPESHSRGPGGRSHGGGGRDRQTAVTAEIPDGTNVVGQFLGERQRFAYETRQTLPQRVVEAFDVIGFPGVLRDSFVSLRRNHTCIGIVLICMKYGLLTV